MAVARMLGYDPARVEVLLYQLVHLVRGGEQTKMSKRRGDVVFLDDFMDDVGVDAARWYLVNRGPDQTIEIDLDLPGGMSQARSVQFNIEAAALEGIERVDESGTLFYTRDAQDAVAPWCPELAEPLALGDVSKRFEILQRLLR